MSTEPALMSLVAVARAIATREVSSREVTRSCLHRIAEWQPRLNAFMAIEAEAALAAADAADLGRSAQSDRPAVRLPVSHPLPVCGAALRKCDAKTQRSRYNGPSGGVLHGHSGFGA